MTAIAILGIIAIIALIWALRQAGVGREMGEHSAQYKYRGRR